MNMASNHWSHTRHYLYFTGQVLSTAATERVKYISLSWPSSDFIKMTKLGFELIHLCIHSLNKYFESFLYVSDIMLGTLLSVRLSSCNYQFAPQTQNHIFSSSQVRQNPQAWGCCAFLLKAEKGHSSGRNENWSRPAVSNKMFCNDWNVLYLYCSIW